MPRHRSIRFQAFPGALMLLAACLASSGQQPDDSGFQSLLKQGFALHQQARFPEAIPVLERARRLQPQDYFANLLLGIDLLRTGKPGEALPRLQLAARTKTNEEIPEDYLGEAYATLGQYAGASEAYRQAMLRGHDSEESLQAWAGFALERFRQIGEMLRSSSAGLGAVKRLQEAATKPPSSLVCAAPIVLLERQLSTEARPATSRATQSTAQTATRMDTAYKLSVCYAIEAGKASERLQSQPGDEAPLHRLRGDILLRLKTDAAAAEEQYRKAIALRPQDPALLERLAEAQLAQGDAEGARHSAQSALALDPHRRAATRTLAFIAMNNREYEQALPLLQTLAAESPDDSAVQVELGRALAQTGKSAEALRYLGPALAHGYPDEKGALHALEARVFRDLGREQEASIASAEARRLSDAFQARSKENPDGDH